MPDGASGSRRTTLIAAFAACEGPRPAGSATTLRRKSGAGVAPGDVRSRAALPGTLRAAHGLPAVIALRGLAASAFFGTEAFLPLVFSQQHALSPTWSGLAISVGALGWFSGSWYQGHYATMSRHALLRWGTTLMVIGVVTADRTVTNFTPSVVVAIVAR